MIRESPWLEPSAWAGRELLESEHPHPAGGEVRRGGAAHPAQAEDDDVGSAHASG